MCYIPILSIAIPAIIERIREYLATRFSGSAIDVGRYLATRCIVPFPNSIGNGVVSLFVADSITWFNASTAVRIVCHLSNLTSNCGRQSYILGMLNRAYLIFFSGITLTLYLLIYVPDPFVVLM